jgi:hypothetical protein
MKPSRVNELAIWLQRRKMLARLTAELKREKEVAARLAALKAERRRVEQEFQLMGGLLL